MIEIKPWGSICELVVSKEAVTIEICLKAKSIPYDLYLIMKQYVGPGKYRWSRK